MCPLTPPFSSDTFIDLPSCACLPSPRLCFTAHSSFVRKTIVIFVLHCHYSITPRRKCSRIRRATLMYYYVGDNIRYPCEFSSVWWAVFETISRKRCTLAITSSRCDTTHTRVGHTQKYLCLKRVSWNIFLTFLISVWRLQCINIDCSANGRVCHTQFRW